MYHKKILGCFRVLRTLPLKNLGWPLEARNLRPNTNKPLKNEKIMLKGPLDREIYIQTQIGHSRMKILHQRGPLDRSIYVQTQKDHSKMRKFLQKGPLDQAIYIQTQIGHSKMRNICQ